MPWDLGSYSVPEGLRSWGTGDTVTHTSLMSPGKCGEWIGQGRQKGLGEGRGSGPWGDMDV